jgi:ElaB/YqjD/DUF883 family membrane-anchored ribosome-binding protein
MENFYPQCPQHSNDIITICADDNCLNNKLCSECFQSHAQSHLKSFKYIADLKDSKFNEMNLKLVDNNWLENSKLNLFKQQNLNKIVTFIDEFCKKISLVLFDKYSKSLEKVAQEYENFINTSLSEYKSEIQKLDNSLVGRSKVAIKLDKEINKLREKNKKLLEDTNKIFENFSNETGYVISRVIPSEDNELVLKNKNIIYKKDLLDLKLIFDHITGKKYILHKNKNEKTELNVFKMMKLKLQNFQLHF